MRVSLGHRTYIGKQRAPQLAREEKALKLFLWIWSLNGFYFYIHWTSPNRVLRIVRKSSWWIFPLVPSLIYPWSQAKICWGGLACGREKRGNISSQEWLQTPSHFMYSRSFPYSLRERGRKLFFILYDLVPAKHVKAYSLAVRSSLGDVAKGLSFFSNKKGYRP